MPKKGKKTNRTAFFKHTKQSDELKLLPATTAINKKSDIHLKQALLLLGQSLRLFPSWFRHHWYRLLVYSLLILILLLAAGKPASDPQTVHVIPIPKAEQDIVFPTPALFPRRQQLSPPPVSSAASILVMDVNSNTVLYEKNADQSLPPASTTKIMTALITLEKHALEDIITVKESTTEGRIMFLQKNEQLTAESLLYGLLVHSANDAAFALASDYPGGSEAFISRMNKKAEELHMDHSHFMNPAGFDDSEHYMSARDLARLSLYALKNPVIAKMAGTRSITVSDVTYSRFHELQNVNELLGKMPGIAGFKTGYTEEAGQSLVALMVKPNEKILSVILGSPDRFGDSQRFLQWVLNNYEWVDLTKD